MAEVPVKKKKNKPKDEDAVVVVPKSAAEMQRLKLEKLMKNPVWKLNRLAVKQIKTKFIHIFSAKQVDWLGDNWR